MMVVSDVVGFSRSKTALAVLKSNSRSYWTSVLCNTGALLDEFPRESVGTIQVYLVTVSAKKAGLP
ncbi:MAG: hypothetical protein LUO95_06545 [Methylococcaceae bacterium]|nr:hypothetical protein [Methylococcaceae bacterium]MDD1616221.1 hypothetical protein [Methylococcaceae bacterium]